VRRVLFLVVVAGLLVGATALAQDGSQGSYDLQEPAVTSAEVLKLPSDAACADFTLLTIRVLPPPGAVLGDLRVRLQGRQVARLTGVPRAASVTVRIGRGRSDVAVTGTTLGGQVVRAAGSYRRCRPTATVPPRRGPRAPRPQPSEPDLFGGSEDG
jgi:hypothetical protein